MFTGVKLNRAKCRICSDIIQSRSVHDWVACKGGHIFIDGGQHYLRYGILKPEVAFEDIIFVDADDNPVPTEKEII